MNGQTVSNGEVVLLQGGRALVPEALLHQLNLTSPGPPVRRAGQEYWPLPVPARVDARSQMLSIDAPASAFAASAHGAPPRRIPPPPSDWGAFLDYDALAERGTGVRSNGMLAQAGVFGPVGRGSQSLQLIDTPEETRGLRLDTAWVVDDPAAMERLRLGDGLGASSGWGRPVRFGGVRWGRAFDTAPGYLTAPTLSLAGETSLPSEVEVYVNDALQRRVQVPAGPFAIEDVPAVTGDGHLRMVVRDLLGREQVVETPYYAGVGLLRPDLNDWSVEAGRVRRRWGIRPADYGDTFAAGTWRHGFTRTFTGEARMEGRAARQTGGLGAALSTDPGTLSASLAASRSPHGPGLLGALGWAYAGREMGLGLSVEQASPHFTQLGLDDPRTLRRRSQARASTGLPAEAGTLSLSVARLEYWREHDDATVTSLTHAVGLGRLATLVTSGTWTRAEHQPADLTLGISLVVPLGGGATVTAGHTASRLSGPRDFLQADRPARDDVDWGARAMRSTGRVERAAAGATLNTPAATLALDGARADGAESARLQAQGSLVLMGGGLFAGRSLGESFAVVDAGHAGVGVSHDNRRVATTDSDGRALVVGLRPYEDNRIGIDASDLPPDVEVAADHLNASPWRGAGAVVAFSLPVARRALLRLERPDGAVVPVGARVRLDGQALPLPVGYDGELPLPFAEAAAELEATWPGGLCRATVPPLTEAAPRALECRP